jgi:hypothetical protein
MDAKTIFERLDEINAHAKMVENFLDDLFYMDKGESKIIQRGNRTITIKRIK